MDGYQRDLTVFISKAEVLYEHVSKYSASMEDLELYLRTYSEQVRQCRNLVRALLDNLWDNRSSFSSCERGFDVMHQMHGSLQAMGSPFRLIEDRGIDFFSRLNEIFGDELPRHISELKGELAS